METCEVNNFETLTTGQISILCPDIYWYSTESVIAYYSQITGAFTFPFPTESNLEPFVLGKYNTQNIMEIQFIQPYHFSSSMNSFNSFPHSSGLSNMISC